ncbi:hypothetical protein THAR02_10985 [Trichoderma harzianum]|uniref:Uncharacterized protein n=1 Tax=Trichoderma harzianum TaxID=5544 RepID=A0A0F9WUS2_TRIHA|nr:hypothetical protein THAR02_10985 [Trichoderma harzianum]
MITGALLTLCSAPRMKPDNLSKEYVELRKVGIKAVIVAAKEGTLGPNLIVPYHECFAFSVAEIVWGINNNTTDDSTPPVDDFIRLVVELKVTETKIWLFDENFRRNIDSVMEDGERISGGDDSRIIRVGRRQYVEVESHDIEPIPDEGTEDMSAWDFLNYFSPFEASKTIDIGVFVSK